ncbi:hypothetical protein BS78_10G094700 [Paspalum vaginatum]|nr:hypothetical protein BS78_10G094700 [Paspalum vaginatum]
MAATTEEPTDAVGPVPFKDSAGAVPLPADSAIASRPSDPKLWVRHFQGTWVLDTHLPGVVDICKGGFTPRRGDVLLASPPKCGTTWLKALAFATMARGVHPPGHAGHPLLRLNPHDCVPFLELLFAAEQGSKMDALPLPRLMATHMHHSLLPSSISNNPDCKIVYICSTASAASNNTTQQAWRIIHLAGSRRTWWFLCGTSPEELVSPIPPSLTCSRPPARGCRRAAHSFA